MKSRRITWARHVARMKEMRNAYKNFVRNIEGNRPLGRPRRSYEDNIRMDLWEISWERVDWICLVVGSCEHGN
jgi:hypothetical protein